MEQLPFPVTEEREEPVVEPTRPKLKLVSKPRPEADVINEAVEDLMAFHDLGEIALTQHDKEVVREATREALLKAELGPAQKAQQKTAY